MTPIIQKLDPCWYRCRVNKRINLPADQGNTMGEWAIWCTFVMQSGEAARQVCHPMTSFLLRQFRTISTVSAAFFSPAFLQTVKCKEYYRIFSVHHAYNTVQQSHKSQWSSHTGENSPTNHSQHHCSYHQQRQDNKIDITQIHWEDINDSWQLVVVFWE